MIKGNSTAHTTDSFTFYRASPGLPKKGLQIPVPMRHRPEMRQAAGLCLYLLPQVSKAVDTNRAEEAL